MASGERHPPLAPSFVRLVAVLVEGEAVAEERKIPSGERPVFFFLKKPFQQLFKIIWEMNDAHVVSLALQSKLLKTQLSTRSPIWCPISTLVPMYREE